MLNIYVQRKYIQMVEFGKGHLALSQFRTNDVGKDSQLCSNRCKIQLLIFSFIYYKTNVYCFLSIKVTFPYHNRKTNYHLLDQNNEICPLNAVVPKSSIGDNG